MTFVKNTVKNIIFLIYKNKLYLKSETQFFEMHYKGHKKWIIWKIPSQLKIYTEVLAL